MKCEQESLIGGYMRQKTGVFCKSELWSRLHNSCLNTITESVTTN